MPQLLRDGAINSIGTASTIVGISFLEVRLRFVAEINALALGKTVMSPDFTIIRTDSAILKIPKSLSMPIGWAIVPHTVF